MSTRTSTSRSLRRRVAAISTFGLAAAGLVALPSSPAAAALPSQCTTSGVTVTCTFTGSPGSTFSLPIPNAVTSIQVHAVGSLGGNSNGAQGGRPAVIDAPLATVDGDVFAVQLRNDGGNAAGLAGRGGGSSTVGRTGGPVLVQAAGGGGAGALGNPGSGSFGGDAGQQGGFGAVTGSATPATPGQPGSTSAGGAGGLGGTDFCQGYRSPDGQPGSASSGGAGGAFTYSGGGGGGGRFGGGGGGAGNSACYYWNGAGGGGGSSTVPTGGAFGISSTESALVRITFTLRPRASYAPTSLAFGAREVASTPASQSVTVTNTGSAPLVMGTATIGGTNASSFTKATDSCTGTSLSAGSSCQVAVQFTPTTVGNLAATLSIPDNSPNSPHVVTLTGSGTPAADLKILGIGSVYTGKNHLVTRAVTAPGKVMTYKVGIFNEDSLGRSYKLKLTPSGSPATAALYGSGFNAPALPTDGSGNFVTPLVAGGKVLTLVLKVTPTAAGQHISRVDVDLLTDFGALIEGVDTETNTPAPSVGTSSYELMAKQGSQPYIGGPVSGQTSNGPALNVGQSAIYTLQLRNNGTTSTSIGLKFSDVDGCAGDFTTVVKVGTHVWTNEAFAGTYITPVLAPGKYTQASVTVKRVGSGCAMQKLQVQSLNGGVPVRSSYLLANASYNATTD